jgi:oligopeptide/dipeptide ABC transporter ATP-binding protein
VLNLLQDLQKQLGLAYLFIAHDLSVVEHVSDRIAVMYLGKVVEIGDAAQVIRAPRHPYTKALLSAVPEPVVTNRKPRIVLTGDIPNPAAPPPGCVFFPRCPHPLKDVDCTQIVPPLEEKAPGQLAACIKEPNLR